MSSSGSMTWGDLKMTAKKHLKECDRLEQILQPYRTQPKFPRCFAADASKPNKITIDKLALMDVNRFRGFTRASFAQQVVRIGNKMINDQKRKGEWL